MQPALEVVSLSPLRTASLLWQPRRDVFVFTLVAKATYVLAPITAELAEEQEYPNEEENHWNDDPARSIQSPSDLAPLKPRAEVTLVGHAFAKPGERARSVIARMVVGDVDKSVEVFADRSFVSDGSLREGPPFSRVPLRYERAAGGAETTNPVGVRLDISDAYGATALPNVQPHGLNITQRGDFISPIGFGPIAASWTTRRSRLGPNAAGWSEAMLASAPMPEGLDPRYFMSAPADQQLGALRSDERIILEHLHVEHPRLVTSLPGIEPRAFLERTGGTPQELSFVADTLWIDTDRSLCTLTWRAQLALEHPRVTGRILVGSARTGWPLSWPELEAQARRGGDSSPSRQQRIAEPTTDDQHMTPVPPSPTQARAVPTKVPPAPGLPFVEGPSDPIRRGPTNKSQTLVFGATNKVVEETTAGAPRDASPAWLRGPRAAPATQAMAAQPQPGMALPSSAGMALPSTGGMAMPPKVSFGPPPEDRPPLPPPAEAPPLVRFGPADPPPTSAWSVGSASGPGHDGLPMSTRPASIGASLAGGVAPVAATVGQQAATRAGLPMDAQNVPPPSPSSPRRAEVARPSVVAPDAVKIGGLGAAAASNAAADAPPPPRANGSAQAQRTPTRPRELVDLLWFDEALPERLRATPGFRDALAPNDESWVTTERRERDVQTEQADRDRRDVVRVVGRGEIFDLSRLDRTIETAFDDDGTYSPPLALTAGDIVFRFDEREALKATITSVSPLIGADKKLRDVVTEATDALKGEWSLPDDVADGFTRRIEQAFAQMPRATAPGYLQSSVDKLLLEGRHYRRKSVFSELRIRGELTVPGSDPVPTYLPDSLALRLPLFARFRCVMIVELRTQEDQHETHPHALLGLAIARSLERRRSS